ncbi:hypothetical protein PHJA_000956700 [Phtheirospermum japonicum]|uniref:Uncharacterized protein n=1 Tax=Phtheirospermum japonicum TaxID=374723 RepID=A0A830BKK9_9LAMI|nr:hypothetical protein PHJA_000956700 [Phtheirospermum japonicum]
MGRSALVEYAQNPGAKVLAQRVKDSIPRLSDVATSFLEAVGVIDAEKHSLSVANAEKHFQAVHEVWKNEEFENILSEESKDERIRNDPSLKYILNETDPAVRLRYWSMEYMLEEYFFRDIGLYALGLDISFADTEDDDAQAREGEMFVGLPEKRAADPTTLARESKRRRSITMPKNEFSPIYQLVNVPSIQCLAQDVERYPKLVELAEELLKSLEDSHFNAKPPVSVLYRLEKRPYARHCEAVWEFWRDQDFRWLMLNHLLEDPHLLVMNGGFEMAEPVDRIRCALTIMTRYWSCVGVAMKIGEVLYRPEAYNNDPINCDDGLSHWYEANQTEINHLLDKIDESRADSRMKLVLKKKGPMAICA